MPRLLAASLAKNTVKTRMARKEVKMATSREAGSLPCSTVSRIFFSVASSVLLSLSAVSDMMRLTG